MTTVQGYYDGNAILALEKLDAQVNQKVQITVLDEFMEEKPKRKAGISKDPDFYMADDFDAPLEDFKEYM